MVAGTRNYESFFTWPSKVLKSAKAAVYPEKKSSSNGSLIIDFIV